MKPVAWIDYIEDSNLYDLNVSGRGVPLYTAPRELMPTMVKDEQGKVVAVTLTNEEHQVQEVLWEAPRELSDEEIDKLWTDSYDFNGKFCVYEFARAILKKASEK